MKLLLPFKVEARHLKYRPNEHWASPSVLPRGKGAAAKRENLKEEARNKIQAALFTKSNREGDSKGPQPIQRSRHRTGS